MTSDAGLSIPRLETSRLLLTVPGVDAAPRALAYYERNRARLEPTSPPWAEGFFTLEHWQRRLAFGRAQLHEAASARLFLFRRGHEHGDVIGVANFTEVVRGAFQACYLGYSIDAAHEGQGLMHEALEAAIPWVFDNLRLHRIMANYLPTNERSGALLRRLGFVVEGYARDYLLIAGRWRDHVLTSRTNTTLPAP